MQSFLIKSKNYFRWIKNNNQLRYMLKFSSILIPSKYGVWQYVQHGKFGQKMAVAKYPASHGNASHIETFNGVFWFKTWKWSLPCKKIWNLRFAINRPYIQHCMILRRTGTNLLWYKTYNRIKLQSDKLQNTICPNHFSGVRRLEVSLFGQIWPLCVRPQEDFARFGPSSKHRTLGR